jgi:hypothetical protein
MKRSDPKLVRVAHRLATMIDPEQCVVVGAMAVAVHGYPRATADVDLVSRLPLPEARRRLAERGVRAALQRGDESEGGFDCLKGALDGVDFDILPPLVPIDWPNVVVVPLGRGDTLRVVDLPTLIHLKLRAGGPQDVLDVAMLLQDHPTAAARAGELAAAFGLAAQLESFTNSPRVRARRPKASRGRRGDPRQPDR